MSTGDQNIFELLPSRNYNGIMDSKFEEESVSVDLGKVQERLHGVFVFSNVD
jgi:hypothetical protein